VNSAPDIPGHSVAGVLGTGGFGTVYRGWQRAVGREVAIKVDNRVLATDRDRRRFFREVNAAGRLSGHPHVIDVYDAGMLGDGRPYLVMELCPGGSLNDELRRSGPLDPARVAWIGVRLADALAAAHAAGVLHRDIKPANVLINRYGMVGLSDFGLASIIDATGGQSVTRDALTPAFAPPESFRQAEPSPAADLYSLAATLYALLSGRPPRFPAGREAPGLAIILALHDQPVPGLPGVPAPLLDLLRAGLAADPAARPPSAAALRDGLAALGAPVPQSSGPQSAGLTSGPPAQVAGQPAPLPGTGDYYRSGPGGPAPGRPADLARSGRPAAQQDGARSGSPAAWPAGAPVVPVTGDYYGPSGYGPSSGGPSSGGPGSAPPVPPSFPVPGSASQGQPDRARAGGGISHDDGRWPGPAPAGPGSGGFPDPGWPAGSGGPAVPVDVPAERPPATIQPPPPRRTAVLAAVLGAGLVLVVVGALLAGAHFFGRGPASGGGPDAGGSGRAAGVIGVFGVPTATGGCPAAAVPGAGARCPARPECWNGVVEIAGDVTVSPLPCAGTHDWETFAIGILPASVATFDAEVVGASPTVRSVCSLAVLLKSRRGAARRIPATDWQIQVVPPDETAFDSGARAYRCLAGTPTGPVMRTSEFAR
jgi:serine/threonine protein kinase